MRISGLIQFILGFVIGLLFLSGMGAAAAYWMMQEFSKKPSEPQYDQSQKQAQTSTKQAKQESASQQGELVKKESSSQSSQQESNQDSIKERFGEQAYKARVTWDTGLNLRAEPSSRSSRVGGVDYNDQVVVIGKSSDGDWQKVYVPKTEQKAWVRAGNVARIN